MLQNSLIIKHELVYAGYAIVSFVEQLTLIFHWVLAIYILLCIVFFLLLYYIHRTPYIIEYSIGLLFLKKNIFVLKNEGQQFVKQFFPIYRKHASQLQITLMISIKMFYILKKLNEYNCQFDVMIQSLQVYIINDFLK